MRRHVIVADDEAHTLLTLSLLLERKGFRVTTFGDGTDLLDKVLELNAADERIDLLIVDVEMPGITGIEVIETFERLNLTLPVVAISGSEARGFLAERLRHGGVWFLEKPFSPEDFLRAVGVAIDVARGALGGQKGARPLQSCEAGTVDIDGKPHALEKTDRPR